MPEVYLGVRLWNGIELPEQQGASSEFPPFKVLDDCYRLYPSSLMGERQAECVVLNPNPEFPSTLYISPDFAVP